jgi:hypothetical protein
MWKLREKRCAEVNPFFTKCDEDGNYNQFAFDINVPEMKT